MDGVSSLPPRGHGLDHGCRASHHVATGEDALHGRLEGAAVHLEGVPARQAQGFPRGDEVRDAGADELTHRRALPDGGDDGVAGDLELRTADRLRAAPPAGVGCAELHPGALDARDPTALDNHLRRRDEQLDPHALALGLLDLDRVRGHLRARSPVQERDLAGAQPQRGARAVDSGVSATHDHHPAAHLDPPPQPHVLEELDALQHARDVLVLDAERGAVPGAQRQEDRVLALVSQGGDGEVPAEVHVGRELHPEVEDLRDLRVEDLLGEAVLGDAVAEHATRLGLGLQDLHRVALFGQVVRTGETTGTCADDGDALAVRRRGLGLERLRHAQIQVGDEALDVVDADRLVDLAAAAPAHLAGTRTDAAADGRQGVLLLDQPDRLAEFAERGQGDVALDVHSGGTGLLAGADAIRIVVREQELERRLARLPDLRRVGHDHHAVGDLGGASWQERARPLDFDHADEARGERLQLLVVAEGGDVRDAVLAGDGEDGLIVDGDDASAVDLELD